MSVCDMEKYVLKYKRKKIFAVVNYAKTQRDIKNGRKTFPLHGR